MIELKKIVSIEDGVEYLDPTCLIDEKNWNHKDYELAKPFCDVLNYYQFNTPDAFGNAPYQRLDGFMQGFMAGAGLTLERGETLWTIRRGTRRIMTIEVPTRPDSYFQAVQDARNTFNDVFG